MNEAYDLFYSLKRRQMAPVSNSPAASYLPPESSDHSHGHSNWSSHTEPPKPSGNDVINRGGVSVEGFKDYVYDL